MVKSEMDGRMREEEEEEFTGLGKSCGRCGLFRLRSLPMLLRAMTSGLLITAARRGGGRRVKSEE
jgi:hypothetical protein